VSDFTITIRGFPASEIDRCELVGLVPVHPEVGTVRTLTLPVASVTSIDTLARPHTGRGHTGSATHIESLDVLGSIMEKHSCGNR
jgi:hypothetical protein